VGDAIIWFSREDGGRHRAPIRATRVVIVSGGLRVCCRRLRAIAPRRWFLIGGFNRSDGSCQLCEKLAAKPCTIQRRLTEKRLIIRLVDQFACFILLIGCEPIRRRIPSLKWEMRERDGVHRFERLRASLRSCRLAAVCPEIVGRSMFPKVVSARILGHALD